MLEIVVYSDCVEGRLARLLWGYGKFNNATLSLSSTRTETLVKENGEQSLKQWPDIIEIAVKGASTEDVLVPPTPDQKNKMYSWIDFAFQRNFMINQKDSLKILNVYLEPNTFLVGNNVTLADLVAYVSIHSWMLMSEPHDRIEFSNIVRWFDHIQHLPGIVNTFKDLPLVVVDKDMDLVTAVMDNVTVTAPSAKNPTKGAIDAKSKKEKSPKPVVDERPIADVSRLNIRVGQVMSVDRHPEADRLYCLKIDLGEPELRDICSGLVGYLQPDEIMSKYVCVLSNMKPKNLRGRVSNGMVLCVSNADHTQIELLHPANGTPIGERVTIEGFDGEPDAVLSTKTGKDPFVAVQPDFNCRDTIAYYKDHRFMTTLGPCHCNSFTSGTIS
ncbi:tRNA binding domain containing protein [Babesia bovis T2Bo]|uniref:tRNA binding domain containing protein n=1 Tax=Babesia bovis TaxID=5865 RepID=A7APU6_BABBO|nr:tRNA binding domain containing protein [Babesia bovis T2Bo]EDO08580.1 tRNA binding domain containing protein [Babesia bovis T2Bo]|eukprot:XP_001612148.1 tRNA binding domain containing protein [Babesia bovis T2Bo]